MENSFWKNDWGGMFRPIAWSLLLLVIVGAIWLSLDGLRDFLRELLESTWIVRALRTP